MRMMYVLTHVRSFEQHSSFTLYGA